MNRLLPPSLLLIVWLALQGHVSVANVVGGLLAVALAGVMIRPAPRRHVVHPIALIRLVVAFFVSLVRSSASVVHTVLVPTPARLRCGVVAVPLSHDSDLVTTVISDAISLTPGTLTLSAEGHPAVLYVHVLGISDPEDVRREVLGLEAQVLAAVTPRAMDKP